MRRFLVLLCFSFGLAWFLENGGFCEGSINRVKPSLYEIEADTADLPDSPYPVPKGVWLFETSLTGEREKDPLGTRSLFTASLLRYGIAQGWELRLSSDGFLLQRSRLGSARGFTDITVGFKKALFPEGRSSPAWGFILQSKIPTASAHLGNKALESTLFFNGSKELGGGWGLEINFGAGWRKREDQKGGFLQAQFLWAVEKEIKRGVGAFVHSVIAFPDQPGRGSSWVIGPGITYVFKDNLQLDTSVTYGLTKASPHSFWRIGLALLP